MASRARRNDFPVTLPLSIVIFHSFPSSSNLWVPAVRSISPASSQPISAHMLSSVMSRVSACVEMDCHAPPSMRHFKGGRVNSKPMRHHK